MKRLLVSCFGLGRLPIAPGTWGSVPAVIIFALLGHLDAPALVTAVVMAILVLYGSVICVIFSPASIAATGRKDPGEVVTDELAGQGLACFLIAWSPAKSILITGIAIFLLFRFFDILKPWPIRKLEKLPEGWGILADDLLAGVYAAITFLICQRIW